MGVSDLFTIRQNEILCPGNGVIIFGGMQDHTAESIKSLEDFLLVWIEEGQVFAGRGWEILRPTIRRPGSQIWVSMNRRWPSDALDEFFLGPRGFGRAAHKSGRSNVVARLFARFRPLQLPPRRCGHGPGTGAPRRRVIARRAKTG